MVRNETYLIYGCQLTNRFSEEFRETEEWDEMQLPWCGKDAKGTTGILEDNMGNNYLLAGKCLAVANDEEGIELTEISCEEIKKLHEVEVRKWIKEKKLHGYSEELKVYVVTHYH